MSTPNDRELNPQPLPPDPPPERKSASPLLWIVLLIALAAIAWYFYNQRSATTATADMTAPMATPDAMTPAPAASTEREPAQRAKPAMTKLTAAKPMAADRDAAPMARIDPQYPAAAFRAGEEGVVMIRADIDANGNATNVDVAKRSSSRDLDRAAVEAVQKAHFEPAMKGGKAVASTVQVPIDFKLDRQ